MEFPVARSANGSGHTNAMTTSPRNDFIGMFASVSRLLKAETERRVVGYGVHAGQQLVLELLWERDGRTPGELADTLNVQRSTISQAVARLAAAGLIRQDEDDADQRSYRVWLTPQGRDLQGTLSHIMAGLARDALSRLSDSDQAELMRLLGQIRVALIRRRGQEG